MHNTYTILFTWHHILVRKVHIKFQWQQASSFGEKVEQVIKKAKNHLFYVNYAHIQLAMNDKDQLLSLMLIFRVWLLYFVKIIEKRRSKEARIIDLARNQLLIYHFEPGQLSQNAQQLGSSINWIWNIR